MLYSIQFGSSGLRTPFTAEFFLKIFCMSRCQKLDNFVYLGHKAIGPDQSGRRMVGNQSASDGPLRWILAALVRVMAREMGLNPIEVRGGGLQALTGPV